MNTVVTDFAQYEELTRRPYSLFTYTDEKGVYRVESTPVSLTAAEIHGGEGWYEYRLPKIPQNILRDIVRFFLLVAQTEHTEVLVRVFYDPNKNAYGLQLPDQIVTGASIVTDEGYPDGMYPVLDIHSHCFYPAFFSAVDNDDEKSNRLYGVVGLLHQRPQFLLRAGTGGQFVELESLQDVFADWDDTDWYEYLLGQMEHIHVQGQFG